MGEIHAGELEIENVYRFNIDFKNVDPVTSSLSYREFKKKVDPMRLQTLANYDHDEYLARIELTN